MPDPSQRVSVEGHDASVGTKPFGIVRLNHESQASREKASLCWCSNMGGVCAGDVKRQGEMWKGRYLEAGPSLFLPMLVTACHFVAAVQALLLSAHSGFQ